jgi:hypothetical protein
MKSEIQKIGNDYSKNTSPITYKDTKKGATIKYHLENSDIIEVTKVILVELKRMVILYGWKVDPKWYSAMVDIIFESHQGRRIEEVVYVLRRGIAGKYGKMTFQFNPSVLVEWLREFDKIGAWDHEQDKVIDNSNRTGQVQPINKITQ